MKGQENLPPRKKIKFCPGVKLDGIKRKSNVKGRCSPFPGVSITNKP